MMSNLIPPLLEIIDLKTYLRLREGTVQAVDGATFTVGRGESVGLVGESGCGKSMTARTIMRINPPFAEVSGQVIYHRLARGATGSAERIVDLVQLDRLGPEIRKIRGAEIAMIFQEPMSSFSPVHTIGDQITEVILLHQEVNQAEARRRAIATLELVGMANARRNIDRYPHQLSGGMRQRAMIAQALSCRPALLIADEPTTALDVTTQAQILKLMKDLQRELGMAILFITHDLGVIARMTKHVLVMYMGKVVESGPVVRIFQQPQHPYTQALLRSVPSLSRKLDRLAVIPGNVPDPFRRPAGCPFHPRCHAMVPGLCDTQEPPNIEAVPGHWARCVHVKPYQSAPGA